MEMTIMGKYRTLVIRPDIELDQHAAEKIRKNADKLLQKTGLKNVAFDMRRVQFMDSSGIGVIMGRYRTVCAIGGSVAVFGMSPYVERIVSMSVIREIVIITDKMQDALEGVAGIC